MERFTMAKVNEYLKVGEAAEYLGVSKDTVRRWDTAGQLKARRHPISDFRLYMRSDLDAFLSVLHQDSAAGKGRGNAGNVTTQRRGRRSTPPSSRD
jgi:excisionase family DNA binding protein